MRDADLPRPAISLEAAVAITGRSRRTWWRRIEEGAVTKLPADARGRALLALDEVRPAIVLALDDAETAAVVRADMGDAAAQAEVGALFALAAMDAAADAAAGPQAEPKVRGGGGRRNWLRPATGWNWPPRRAMPTPCTGLACCTPPAVAARKTSTWR